MKDKIVLGIQIVSGLILVVFGLNGFLQFMETPVQNQQMGSYLGAVFATGFIFPIVSVVLLVSGISFLTNKFSSLFAIILMPVILNAFLAHLFLDTKGIEPSAFLLIATILVMINNKQKYVQIFKA